MITRELIMKKGNLGMWRVSNGVETCYKITDDGGGYCNSIEEMCEYYNGEEVKLVNIILEKGNDVVELLYLIFRSTTQHNNWDCVVLAEELTHRSLTE